MKDALERGALPSRLDAPRTVLDVVLRYLEAEGIEVVFGVPGGLLHAFFAAVEAHSDLRLIVCKHEGGAAFMADGFARASGRMAVCASTAGPGATNLLTGVAVAFADGIPMLVLTGQVPSHVLGHGASQETNREDMDLVAMFAPVTKYSTMVTAAASMPFHVRRALRLALTGRPGPVHLNVPVDLWLQPVEEDWFDPQSYRSESSVFDRRAVHDAAQMLLDATHPVLLVGGGARAEDHLVSLAEMLPARVATSPRGKGVFPEDHPLSLGILGYAGHRDAREVLLSGQVDVLLTIGASLNETTTFSWRKELRPTRALLQVDIDADRIGRNYPVDIALVGDATAVLLELVFHLHREVREGRFPKSQWNDAPPLSRGHERHDSPQYRVSDQVPITPQRWRAELCEVLPNDTLIFSDVGGHMLFNFHDLVLRRGQRFLVNLGFASMGHGTAGPIGAAIADPSRPVVAIVGDGCFTMNGMELLTAMEHEVRVVWIVENNQMHGITWHGSRMVGKGLPLNSVRYRQQVHVAEIAKAMGLEVYKVERPGEIGPAVLSALAAPTAALIEVLTDPMIPPPLVDRAKGISGKS
ncbi:MAG: thiamine pyrophosphate-binding protein [Deltaproteobacteria bacterium]|nr:thiamine pyrophosphate-binding protein [Deltaproteobacteria bacterium]